MGPVASADKPSGLTPGLATEWKTDPANPKRWIFTLRPGVKFHDGKSLVADDVVFSFDRAFKNDAPGSTPAPPPRSACACPPSCRGAPTGRASSGWRPSVVDSTIPYVVTWVGITHRGAWEAAGKNWDAYLNKAVGTGPWKLESFNLRERAVLLRNPDYWDKPRGAEMREADPAADAGGEHPRRRAARRAGGLHRSAAARRRAVAEGAPGSQIVTNTYQHNWTWHLSRVEGSPFNDIRVRKALNLAVDRAGMKELLGGLMEEGAGFVPAANPWRGNPSFKPTYDPDAAKKLLAEAGYGAGASR